MTVTDKETLYRTYPVVVVWPVAWGEMDAFGHVNNVMYFRYFENARIAYAQRIGMIEVMAETGIGPILASTHCRYKLPLTYPDSVHIGARVSKLEEDRFTMEYCVLSEVQNKVAATGDGVIVSFDYRAHRKTPLPAVLVERARALEATCAPVQPPKSS